MSEGEETKSVRERLARISWVGVVLIAVVVALLGWLTVRYLTTVDTMRAWIVEDGLVVAEVLAARAPQVKETQRAQVRVGRDWLEGQVIDVGSEAVVTGDEGRAVRHVQVRIAVQSALGEQGDEGRPVEVRILTGWPW